MSKMVFVSTLAFAAFMFWSALDATRSIGVDTGHNQQRTVSADDAVTLTAR